MNDDVLLAKYLAAAGIERIPKDLSAPRFVEKHHSPEQRRDYLERTMILTKIWNCADTDTGRLAGLKAYMEGPEPRDDVAKILEEHGFVEAKQYGKRLNLNEYEFTDDGKIIAYETTKDFLGRPSTTQRTFDSPTLKRIRDYLGY